MWRGKDSIHRGMRLSSRHHHPPPSLAHSVSSPHISYDLRVSCSIFDRTSPRANTSILYIGKRRNMLIGIHQRRSRCHSVPTFPIYTVQCFDTVQVGDYGRINRKTGEFEVEGNVYKHSSTAEKAALFPPDVGYPTLSYTVSSHVVTRTGLEVTPQL